MPFVREFFFIHKEKEILMNTFVYLNHNYSSLLWQFSTQKMFNEGKKKV